MRCLVHLIKGSLLAATLLFGTVTVSNAQSSILSLDNVIFADGGTATGVFGLNVSGYTASPIDIVTTGVTFPAPNSYFSGGADGTPPSTDFDFTTAGYVYDLHLEFAEPVSPGASGELTLVAGGGTLGSGFTGSYEECVSSDVACGVSYGTVNFITSGDVLVPEPASLAILGAGVIGLAAVRRRRVAARNA